MGTRSGDIDPTVIFHLRREGGLSVDDIDDLLNHRSGLLGLTGVNDMREVLDRRAAGDPAATLAFDVYCRRITGYVGAYYALLGRVDAITFTAGVGEHAAPVRAAALAGLERLGITVDDARNDGERRPGDLARRRRGERLRHPHRRGAGDRPADQGRGRGGLRPTSRAPSGGPRVRASR